MQILSLPSSRPGSLKRGMISLAEESIMKRSRTSSISSGSGVHAPRGTPGTTRNPIHSSYSSTLGISQVTLSLLHYNRHGPLQVKWSCKALPPCFSSQWKKRSAPSPPLSSPGSSRSQTPEGASKRSRYVSGSSPPVIHIQSDMKFFKLWFHHQRGRWAVSQLSIVREVGPGSFWKITCYL